VFVVLLAGKYGRYGYRRITVLLRAEGWIVNHKLLRGYGEKKVLKYLRVNLKEHVFISMTAPV